MNTLLIHEWRQETNGLLDQARGVLQGSSSGHVREMAFRLPASGESEDSRIRLVFAGQYSSGKSSIIKALTGRNDIPTGAGITTDRVQDYDWTGVVITDTPGIHTSIRPDHDEDSYRAISEADLLVFVISNELFDEHIGQEYRKLTVDQDKGHETIVVVNKMDRHADGNSPESRMILEEALRQPLEPFTSEEMRLTFIAAESAMEAVEEADPEISEMLQAQGNISALVESLNRLVNEKGLSAKHTTRLYTARQVLSEALETVPSGDPDADALLLVYNQNIRAITQSAATIRGEVGLAITKAKDLIRNAGDEVNDTLEAEGGDKAERRATETAEIRVKEAVEELDSSIAGIMLDALPELENRLEQMRQGDLHQSIAVKLGEPDRGTDWGRGMRVIQFLASRLGETAATIATSNAALRAGITGLGRFSGSQGHTAILAIGHTFGHSFRPWQAVRLTQTIGRAAVVLSVASAVLDIALEIKEQRDEERREREALEARQNIRAEFDRIAAQVEREAWNSTESFIGEVLEDPLQEITKARDDLDLAREHRNSHLAALNSVRKSVDELIRQIHSSEDYKNPDNVA